MKQQPSQNRLFFNQPATAFEQCLVLGNGRLGVSAYGGVTQERLHLNEDTFWSGTPHDANIPNAKEQLAKARKKIASGDYLGGQEIIEQHFESEMTAYYLALGDLVLRFEHAHEASHYERALDLEHAVMSVAYQAGDVSYARELFVSHPDQTAVLHLSASAPGALHFSVEMESKLCFTATAQGAQCCLDVQAPGAIVHDYQDPTDENCLLYPEQPQQQGMRAQAIVHVEIDAGVIEACDGLLRIDGAQHATLRLVVNTTFAGWNKSPATQGKAVAAINSVQLRAARALPFASLKQRHCDDYVPLFCSVALNLGASAHTALPTDERLLRFAGDDPQLLSLLFQYGRYLMLACSREGSQAANLQGIWNHCKRPMWRCGYTTNINLQMNYWPVHSIGLSRCALPLLELVEQCAQAGRRTAREHYGARGFVIHHNTDLWRVTWPVGRGRQDSAAFGFWNMGGVWLCRNLWDFYEYTMDKQLLRDRLYPLMREAALFCLDILSQSPDGTLWVTPSTSPENRFYTSNQTRCGVASSATMTIALIRDLFDICIQCSKILQTDFALCSQLQEVLPRLYPYAVGSKGQLLEWDTEFDEPEPHHRHTSHLYGLYPAQQIVPSLQPALAQACRNTLQLRGDDGPGWGLCWRICFWARLGDAEHAYRLLLRQMTPVLTTGVNYTDGGGLYPNLLCAHPPFQIDGNFGYCAAVCEMLVHSTRTRVTLLPALPQAWREGSVQGLTVRGGLVLCLRWHGGALAAWHVTAPLGYTGEIVCGQSARTWKLTLAPNEIASFGAQEE